MTVLCDYMILASMICSEGTRVSLTIFLVASTTAGSSSGQDVSLIRIVTSIWSYGSISIEIL